MSRHLSQTAPIRLPPVKYDALYKSSCQLIPSGPRCQVYDRTIQLPIPRQSYDRAIQLPSDPHSQLSRNPFYKVTFCREVNPYVPTPETVVLGGYKREGAVKTDDGSQLEAERQKIQAENKLQIARTRELAMAERAQRRFEEEERRRQRQEQLLTLERQRAEWQQLKRRSEENSVCKLAALRRGAQNHLIEQDQERARQKRNDKNMHMLKDRVASLHKNAVWWEDVGRQQFYEHEEKFVEAVTKKSLEQNPAFMRID